MTRPGKDKHDISSRCRERGQEDISRVLSVVGGLSCAQKGGCSERGSIGRLEGRVGSPASPLLSVWPRCPLSASLLFCVVLKLEGPQQSPGELSSRFCCSRPASPCDWEPAVWGGDRDGNRKPPVMDVSHIRSGWHLTQAHTERHAHSTAHRSICGLHGPSLCGRKGNSSGRRGKASPGRPQSGGWRPRPHALGSSRRGRRANELHEPCSQMSQGTDF